MPGDHDRIDGVKQLDKAIVIDQSAIGRTPRSNPATYTGAFTQIRELFANTPEANIRGYKAGRFSFNVKNKRCENCQGDGVIKIEMHFLPDVYIQCPECHGKRYNREALEIKYKGKTISDILEMTVEQACEFFTNIPAISRKLETINEVGLGYVKLGQPATTFSGGEAQCFDGLPGRSAVLVGWWSGSGSRGAPRRSETRRIPNCGAPGGSFGSAH